MKIKLTTLLIILVLLVGGGLGTYFLLKDKDLGVIKTTKNDSIINIQDSKEKIEKLEKEKSELENKIQEIENEKSDLQKKVNDLESEITNDTSSLNSSSNKKSYSVEDVSKIITNYLKKHDKNIKEVKMNKIDIYTKGKVLAESSWDKKDIESEMDFENEIYGKLDFDIKFYSTEGWEHEIASDGNDWVHEPDGLPYLIDEDGWANGYPSYFRIINKENVEFATGGFYGI